ncbi:hypothetical protein Gotri_020973, partial [Gossypium trilobum]|nr:hypothetical protein [Gossypium trilobum]
IPRAANYKISGNISNEITRVSELIDSPTRTWKVKDVEATFSEIDAGKLSTGKEIVEITNRFLKEIDEMDNRTLTIQKPKLLKSILMRRMIVISSDRLRAEAHACFQAVGIGLTMGVKKIEVEGDALTIIKKCQSTAFDKLEIGVYIKDIQQCKKGNERFTWKDQCLGMPWNRWDLVNKENKSLIEAK